MQGQQHENGELGFGVREALSYPATGAPVLSTVSSVLAGVSHT